MGGRFRPSCLNSCAFHNPGINNNKQKTTTNKLNVGINTNKLASSQVNLKY